MIYLDHASTSPPDPEVIEEVARAMAQFFGNPASAHRLGYEAEKAGQGSLMTLGRLLGADPERLVVTSGGTESTNLALKGFFEANPRSPRRIVTSALEHASTHEVCNALAARGIDVVRVGSDRNGAPSLEELDGALSRGPGLISLIHVNNETGAVLDMAELVRIRDRRCPGTPIHLDFVQGAFKMPLDLGRSRIQMVSTSAHKFHGPRGIGLLALARDVRLAPEILGGGQQGGLRSGTLDIPSLLGMAKAAVRMQSLVRDGIDGTRAFRDRFLAVLQAGTECIVLSPEQGYPGILCLAFPGIPAEVLVRSLSDRDVFLSAGSACSSRRPKPSRVLAAMGIPAPRLAEAVRISVTPSIDPACAEPAAAIVLDVVRDLGRRPPGGYPRKGGKEHT